MRRTALVVTLLASPFPASAQIFTGVAPTTAVAMPVPDAPKPAAPKSETPKSETPIPPKQVIRHLPGTLDGVKISGETGELRWPLSLTAAQAAAPSRFRLGYVSAVSILPGASSLSVRVNGTEIGSDVIDAPRGLRKVEFAVPEGLLREGFNAIQVGVRQRHRVDCSVAATYELWTKLDPVETGLVFDAGVRGIEDVADLPALATRADGALPIHVLLTGKTNPSHLQRLIRATQAVALASRALQPVVDFEPVAIGAEGVDLAIGTRATLRVVPRLADRLGAAGPLVRVLPAPPLGRPTVLVTGSSDAELDQALALLSEITPLKGTPQGLRAAENYPALRVEGGETLRLAALGLGNEEFSGRFLRKSFNVMLPADFLASDYGRGTFDLAGGYAAGLDHGAQVRIDINGKSSGIIKLPYAAGDVFRHNQLFLPLGLMRPGLNQVEIFAETPRPADATCAADAGKRFLFLDSSTIVLPTLARVRRLPDLAEATNGGIPYAEGKAHLVVPKPDRAAMGSALSLTARAAVAAGRPIPFAFSTRMPEAIDGSTLVVAPARALDPDAMRRTGLDPAAVERAWRDRPAMADAGVQGRWWLTNTDGPQACRLPSPVRSAHSMPAPAPLPVTPVAVAPAPKGESEDLLDSWDGNARPTRTWLAAMRDGIGRFEGAMAAFPAAVRGKFARAPHDDGIRPEASLILAQGMSGAGGNVTTIVTAPDTAALHAAVACLFDPQVWSKLHGRLAVVDAATGGVTATDATSFHYSAGSRVSLANSRLVMAGWFSLDPLAFVAAAMAMALMLSGTTLWFVRGVGRKSE